jgi:hypothetical protein
MPTDSYHPKTFLGSCKTWFRLWFQAEFCHFKIYDWGCDVKPKATNTSAESSETVPDSEDDSYQAAGMDMD